MIPSSVFDVTVSDSFKRLTVPENYRLAGAQSVSETSTLDGITQTHIGKIEFIFVDTADKRC